jgi:hypothetical protein
MPNVDISQPLSPHTFAGMVEQGLLERFPEDDIQRVLTSWRLLEKDYLHKEYVGEEGKEGESEMIQECHSYVPGLSIQPFWNAQDFDWAGKLEEAYPSIVKEFDQVTKNMEELKAKGNNIWAGALTDDASAYGRDWKTLVLMNRGIWDETNAKLFPKTATAIHKSGIPVTEAFFASMKGPSKIEQHSDFTNFVLTSHLALKIPCNGENKCRIRVGDETREWINGNVMVFDTSLMHDAINETDEMRYILMFRVWHPDLTPIEREALQFTYDCLEVPDLVSQDVNARNAAQKYVESIRAFPQIRTASGGFGSGGSSERKKTPKKKKAGRK